MANLPTDIGDDTERSASIMPQVARRPSARRIRKAEFVGDPHFPPVANGLDYLVSVVDLLESDSGGSTARELKYAVLHLAAGAEVLLKARLQIEHWSLVFTHPGQATREALEDGSLSSCGPDETRQRLKNIVGITFSGREEQALKDLARSRNQLQHWGLTGEQARASVVASTTARVLNFLVAFVEDHLLPWLQEPELSEAREEMGHVRDGLAFIEQYVRERMKDLAPRLGRVRRSTVQCPLCRQWALVAHGYESPQEIDDLDIDDMFNVECLFCTERLTPREAAHEYAGVILGHFGNEEAFDLPAEVHLCPECKNDVLVRGAATVAAPNRPVDFCFACATAPVASRS
ncbi:hypothetical protein [Streptomyces sp. NPDC056891]|uniref:hypothetical protein n=1 Tax=unclassified Streptomyces TaxID=2593676 RepID=UPI0036C70BED